MTYPDSVRRAAWWLLRAAALGLVVTVIITVATSTPTSTLIPTGDKMRIVVLHEFYDCDTGCCGHIVEVDGVQKGEFLFRHPGSDDLRKFAEEIVREACGDDHVQDLDWANCRIVDD